MGGDALGESLGLVARHHKSKLQHSRGAKREKYLERFAFENAIFVGMCTNGRSPHPLKEFSSRISPELEKQEEKPTQESTTPSNAHKSSRI